MCVCLVGMSTPKTVRGRPVSESQSVLDRTWAASFRHHGEILVAIPYVAMGYQKKFAHCTKMGREKHEGLTCSFVF